MLLLSALSSVAWPCAGLFHDIDQLAESEAQSVILEAVEDGVQVSYSVQYSGDAASFGWLIPIFGEFVAIEDGDPARFERLQDLSQPTVRTMYASSDPGSSRGCSNSKAGADFARGDTGSFNSIDVVAEGFTGSYAYQILDTSSSTEFLSWLDENGWETGGAEAAIEAYVNEGGIQFAAITLSEAGGELLPPLSITYSGDQLRFPATMARYAMSDEVRTIVYVHGDATADITGDWTASTIPDVTGNIDDDPSALYDEALRSIGDLQRGYGLIFSAQDPDSEHWITRFETLAQPSAHTADVQFTVTDQQQYLATTIWLHEDTSAERRSAAWMLVPITAIGIGTARRRRRKNTTSH